MINTKISLRKPGSATTMSLTHERIPELNENEVLVKTEACGVAFADILIREGLYPNAPRKNFTPGYDIVGIVVKVGNAVTDFSTGDRVLGLIQIGGYAKFATVDSSQLFPCPADIDASHVIALTLNYTTAYQMLTRTARVRPGDNVLIHGAAGGVGSALIDIAKNLNVNIYATLSERKWHDIPHNVMTRGRITKISYQTAPFEKSLSQISPQGMDVVFDPIGGKHLKRSYSSLGTGGMLVSYGISTSIKNGRKSLSSLASAFFRSLLSPLKLIKDSKTIAGYDIWEVVNNRPEWIREDIKTLLNLYENGEISPVIGKSFALEDAAKAHELMSTSQVSGKIVLTM